VMQLRLKSICGVYAWKVINARVLKQSNSAIEVRHKKRYTETKCVGRAREAASGRYGYKIAHSAMVIIAE